MNPSPPPDIITWTFTRAALPELSMSGVAHQIMIDAARESLSQQAAELTNANASLTEQNIKNAALITNLKMQLADALKPDNHVDTLRAEIVTLETNVRTLTAERDAALARIEVLVNTPPGTPPPGPVVEVITPTITKQRLANLAGVTITTGDDAPTTKKDNQTRNLMALCGEIGFNAVRWHMNLTELRQQVAMLKLKESDCIPVFARAHGLTPMIDTLDNIASVLNKAQLLEYMNGLKLLGFQGGFFNDANQYKDAAKFPAGTLEKLVALIREAAPDMPLFASVTASAKVADYKPLFDYVEFQSFGRITEFDDFLRLPCDLLCIDGQRKASADYLRQMTTLLLESGKDAFYCYTALDEDTNWLNDPETVAIYKSFLAKWRAGRLKIVAQEVVEAD